MLNDTVVCESVNQDLKPVNASAIRKISGGLASAASSTGENVRALRRISIQAAPH